MTDSRTATEILRELLDARRVEHEDNWCGDVTYTKWQGIGGMWFAAQDCFCNGQLLYIQGRNMTPEQAIAATLGSGEFELLEKWFSQCRKIEKLEAENRNLVEKLQAEYQRGYDDGIRSNCGRKVKE